MDAKSSIEEPLELMKNALGQKFQNDDDQKALERLAHLGDEIRIAREAQLEYQLDKLSDLVEQMERAKAKQADLKMSAQQHHETTSAECRQLDQQQAHLQAQIAHNEQEIVRVQDELNLLKSRVEHERELTEQEMHQSELNQIQYQQFFNQLRLKMYRALGFDLLADRQGHFTKIRARNAQGNDVQTLELKNERPLYELTNQLWDICSS